MLRASRGAGATRVLGSQGRYLLFGWGLAAAFVLAFALTFAAALGGMVILFVMDGGRDLAEGLRDATALSQEE